MQGNSRSLAPSAPVPEPQVSPPHRTPKVDPGMVEVCVALAGIATAIIALSFVMSDTAAGLRIMLWILGGYLLIFSSYAALWFLARYCLEGDSFLGFEEIWVLLKSSTALGPYWFLAMGVLILLVLSILVVSAFALLL